MYWINSWLSYLGEDISNKVTKKFGLGHEAFLLPGVRQYANMSKINHY
jgi:hypothetical protein